MTPEQLRASILQYAMEGKLVKQDPNDEPASELLKKIENEKLQLIKEGKIKKNKKLLAITDDEKQFDIPNGWEWVKLGNIVDYVQRGKSPKYDKESTRYPIISQKCVQWDGIHLEFAKHLKEDFWEGLPSYRFVTEGDLLLNSTGTGTVGRVIKVTEPFNKVPVDSHVTVIRLNQNICNNYILYFLMSPIIQKNLDDYLTGTTKQKEFGLASIQNIVVSLPPLEEQKRIVAKIEKLMPLVDEYAESYNRLQKIDNEFEDKLKQSVLQYAMEGKLVKQDPSDEPASELIKKIENEKAELIKEGKIKKNKKLPAITDDEKPFDIPNSWEWIRLGDYAEKITDEVASGSFAAIRDNVRKYKTENYAIMVKTADFANQFSKNLTYTDEHGYNFLNNSNLFGGELILSNIGSIGKCFIVPKLNRPMTLAPNSIMTKLIDPKLNKFLYYFIKSPIGNFELLQIASGTTMKKFNKTNLKGILIPIPPLNEQKRIVFEIEKIVNSIDKLSK